jgi:hypothetical protein
MSAEKKNTYLTFAICMVVHLVQGQWQDLQSPTMQMSTLVGGVAPSNTITGIPVHFIWVHPYLQNPDQTAGTDDEGLKKAYSVVHDWMIHLPSGGKYYPMFWTDLEVHDKFPELVPVLSKIKVCAWISDVLRYQILLRYGGVYLDTDVLFVHDFTQLMGMFNSSFSVCQTPWTPVGDATLSDLKSDLSGMACESIINAIIASPKEHPAVKCAAERSMLHTRASVDAGREESDSVEATGPACWTKCVRQEGQIAVLPSWSFLPCSFFMRNGCNPRDYDMYDHVYGMHEWTWSWS